MEIETVQPASKVLRTQLRLSILAEDQTKKGLGNIHELNVMAILW